MPGTEQFKIPSWVPQPVQEIGLKLLDDAPTEGARDVLKRLFSSKRMQTVWRELTKQKRDLPTYKARGFVYKQESSSTRLFNITPPPHSHLADFFERAYGLVLEPPCTMTWEEVQDARAALLETSEVFGKLSVDVKRWHNHPEVSSRFNTHISTQTEKAFPWSQHLRHAFPWTSLNQLANELESFALYFHDLTETISPSSGAVIVRRRSDHDELRAYVITLARLARRLFGTPLYSVVATTSSVALRKRINPAFVKRAVQKNR
jgi:hypothetical protein